MSKRKVSCLPCRMRKVKCDGQKPCQRCTAKNSQDCIYTKPGTVGRPPKNAVVNKLVLSKTAQLSFCKEFIFENVSTISDITSNRYLDDPPSAHLDYYINHFFATYFDKKTKLIDNTRIRLNNEVEKERKSSQERPSAASSAKLYHLTHYFVWMSADISNILTRRLSKLRLTYYTDLNFTISALAADKTTTFFETPSADALVINPLNSLPPQQALKLIEYFYRVHPYSMLINKTMLLQSYWTDTADHLLLSVIYGTTLFKSVILDNKPLSLWDGMAKSRRNPFLDYAHLLLTKATTEATLSKFQAIVLLALFEVTFGYPKKGMALFALSFMIAARLGLFDNNIPPGYSPVEKELLMVTFWAAYKCTVRGCVESR